MSKHWVAQNLQNALDTWNNKLGEIWKLITQSPSEFNGGKIWNVILNINQALQAIGLSLLVLFFVIGIVKTCSSLTEIKRPEHALRLFLRFVLAKIMVTYGLDLMLKIFEIIQGIISTITKTVGFDSIDKIVLPSEMVSVIEKCKFLESIPLWAVTLLGGLFITVLSFIIILSVYGRFFKLYMYTAIAPIPLSTFASEATQNTGKSFLKSYCSVCAEGAIIVLACVIFSLFASTPPSVDLSVSPVTMVWQYIAQLSFNMLVLTGTIKLSSQVVREMTGL